jgi:hypothetical protein
VILLYFYVSLYKSKISLENFCGVVFQTYSIKNNKINVKSGENKNANILHNHHLLLNFLFAKSPIPKHNRIKSTNIFIIIPFFDRIIIKKG